MDTSTADPCAVLPDFESWTTDDLTAVLAEWRAAKVDADTAVARIEAVLASRLVSA